MTVSRLEKVPNRDELIEYASSAFFYGESMGEMSREDLLMIIGFQAKDQERTRERHAQQDAVLNEFVDRRKARRSFFVSKRKAARKE